MSALVAEQLLPQPSLEIAGGGSGSCAARLAEQACCRPHQVCRSLWRCSQQLHPAQWTSWRPAQGAAVPPEPSHQLAHCTAPLAAKLPRASRCPACLQPASARGGDLRDLVRQLIEEAKRIPPPPPMPVDYGPLAEQLRGWVQELRGIKDDVQAALEVRGHQTCEGAGMASVGVSFCRVSGYLWFERTEAACAVAGGSALRGPGWRCSWSQAAPVCAPLPSLQVAHHNKEEAAAQLAATDPANKEAHHSATWLRWGPRQRPRLPRPCVAVSGLATGQAGGWGFLSSGGLLGAPARPSGVRARRAPVCAAALAVGSWSETTCLCLRCGAGGDTDDARPCIMALTAARPAAACSEQRPAAEARLRGVEERAVPPTQKAAAALEALAERLTVAKVGVGGAFHFCVAGAGSG